METETLEDHLRRATRNFTSPLPEELVLEGLALHAGVDYAITAPPFTPSTSP